MSPEEITALAEEMAIEHAKKWLVQSESELRGWLALDTWTEEEGLLLIVGIDPGAAVVEWDGWVSALGAKINNVRIRNCRPLSKPPVFLAIPSPKHPQISDAGHPGRFIVLWDERPDAQEDEVKWEKLDILQKLEGKLTRVNRLWISGQHDEQRYPPVYFIEWAEKHQVEIPWLSHARERGWLVVSIKTEDGDTPALRAQEEAILTALKEKNYDPKALPKNPPGKRGVKSEIRKVLGKSILFNGTTTFDKAWQRLRELEMIGDSS